MSKAASAIAAMHAMISPDPELNTVDRNIYAYLVFRANGGRLCWKTTAEIMADLNIGSRNTVSASTNKLKSKGLIEIKRRLRDSNHYIILDPGGRLYGGEAWTPPWDSPPVAQDSIHQGPVAQDSIHQDSCTRFDTSVAQNPIHLGGSVAQDSIQESVPQVSKNPKEVPKTTVVALRAPAPDVAVSVPDPIGELFSEGMLILAELRPGMAEREVRTLIGKLRKEAGEDCDLVRASLRRAATLRPAGSVYAFCLRVIQAKVEKADPMRRDPSKLSGAQRAAYIFDQEKRELLERERREALA